MPRISLHRGVAASVTAAALVLLSACGSSSSTSSAGGSGGTAKVAAIIKGLDNPFFQSMQQGIEEQAKTSGTTVTVQAANSITDTTGQADKLTSLAGQDFSCFIVNPISGTNLIQGIAQLAAKKKTIVNIDSPVDADRRQGRERAPRPPTSAPTTSRPARRPAQQMLTFLPNGGKVAAIGGIAGDVTSGARVDGFSKAITGKLTLVQTVAANWERQEALTQATNILRAQPDLAGFFVANDDMGLGVARAVATAGKTGKVRIISVDGIKDALRGGQGRAGRRGRRAVPVRDRPDGHGGLRRRRQGARPCRRTSRRRSRWSPRTSPTRRWPPPRSRSAPTTTRSRP